MNRATENTREGANENNNIISSTVVMPEGHETSDTVSFSLRSYAGKIGLAVSTLFATSVATITTTTAPITSTTIAASSASAITAAEALFPMVVKI